jgi:hypothetical protein
MLKKYRGGETLWLQYEHLYNKLLAERRPERVWSLSDLDGACLLCSEHTAGHCHRRLAAEYFRSAFITEAPLRICHL